MKFWVLLWILGFRMAWVSRRNDAFKNKLKGMDAVLQFQTENGGVARHYILKDNVVNHHRGVHPDPTMALIFKDSGYAFRAIAGAGKDPGIFMKGMQEKNIAITGDMSLMMWFMSIVKYLVPAFLKKKKKKKAKA